METHRIQQDIVSIGSAEPVPGHGVLPILSTLLLGREPVLVDTGTVRDRDAFVKSLETVVDPEDLRWIVLTHPDADHSGALPLLLERAPRARLVLNVISTGKLGASFAPPMDRVVWRNAGESLDAGGRVLHFLRPPMYDCPSTVAVFDSHSRALLASDAFGAFLPANPPRFADLPEREALEGMSAFCRANSPWLADTRPDRYADAVKALADLRPEWLLSAHLPAATASEATRVLERAFRLPSEGRLPLPGQSALEAMLASVSREAA